MTASGSLRTRIFGFLGTLLVFAIAFPIAAQSRDEVASGEIPLAIYLSVAGREVARFEAMEAPDLEIGRARISGMPKYSNLTLKRGVVSNSALFEWIKKAESGREDVRPITIQLVAEGELRDEVLVTWQAYEAWPAKWKGFSLNGKGNNAMIETLELSHEGFRTL